MHIFEIGLIIIAASLPFMAVGIIFGERSMSKFNFADKIGMTGFCIFPIGVLTIFVECIAATMRNI